MQRVAYGVEEETKETVQVPVFGTEVARIRVNAGTTRNLGDYNSARVDVMIEMRATRSAPRSRMPTISLPGCSTRSSRSNSKRPAFG